MRTLVVGDVHGRYAALLQVLYRAGYRRGEDRLVFLGDLTDRGPRSREVVEYVLRLPERHMVKGNHDAWFAEWGKSHEVRDEWLMNGGGVTLSSYEPDLVPPEEHWRLLDEAPCYLELDDKAFVHGGFDPDEPVEEQPDDHLMWSRTLTSGLVSHERYRRIFIGHTPTLSLGMGRPNVLKRGIVVCVDTGAAYLNGRLSVVDSDTMEVWQSDVICDLDDRSVLAAHG